MKFECKRESAFAPWSIVNENGNQVCHGPGGEVGQLICDLLNNHEAAKNVQICKTCKCLGCIYPGHDNGFYSAQKG